MNETEFRAALQADGYDEVLVKTFETHQPDPMHTHDFDARVFVVAGQLMLETEGQPNATFRPGQMCDVPRGTRHREHYWPASTIVVGRRRG